LIHQNYFSLVNSWPRPYCPKFSNLQVTQIIDHGPKMYDASTNLPARGPTSTNLFVCSPTLRTSSPVVQHTWSNNYEPPCSQQLSSVSTEHTNLPARIPTREHHNMKLPFHIIMCSPPVMNLPAHDTISISCSKSHITSQ